MFIIIINPIFILFLFLQLTCNLILQYNRIKINQLKILILQYNILFHSKERYLCFHITISIALHMSQKSKTQSSLHKTHKIFVKNSWILERVHGFNIYPDPRFLVNSVARAVRYPFKVDNCECSAKIKRRRIVAVNVAAHVRLL